MFFVIIYIGDIMNSVIISIKPEYTKLIETQEKNYEFRNYYIKDIKYMIVYESGTSYIKYIMEVDTPVKYPKKIDENGVSNNLFNKGDFYEYAYPIKHLYLLKKPISLTELKSRYNCSAPQKYCYLNKYPELEKNLKNKEIEKLY